MKKRLDQHLLDEGFFETRQRARAAVMEGLVSVDGRQDVKPGTQVRGSENFEVREPASRFVSRGGVKLEGALAELGIDVSGLDALDVGASTGGFTDCLLKRGASRVIALDVGKGQLHWKLRNDPRVTIIEGFNARELSAADLPFEPGMATVDVSFISLRKVIEPLAGAIGERAPILALVKPQFEAGIGQAPKGVVRDPATHLEVLTGISRWLTESGFTLTGVAPSGIRGPKGNSEFFIWIEREGRGVSARDLESAVRRAHDKA